jgi:hypothetical protein
MVLLINGPKVNNIVPVLIWFRFPLLLKLEGLLSIVGTYVRCAIWRFLGFMERPVAEEYS